MFIQKWRPAQKSRRSVKSACWLLPLLVLSAEGQAVSDSRLWLPSSYIKHTLKLKKAAETVEREAPECLKILRGGLHEDLSTQDRPVFRIICRNEARKSFALLIDGSDMGVVDPDNPAASLSFAQLRRQREQEAARQRQAREQERQQRFWELCRERLEKRTVNMQQLQWLTTERPAPEILPAEKAAGADDAGVESPTTIRYLVDFDAVDFKGKSLHYRGECTYTTEDDNQVRIRPRR